MWRWTSSFLVLVFLTACNSAVENYVNDVNPPNRNPASSISSAGPSAIKATPGNITSTATNKAFKGTVTPTNETLKSSRFAAKITFHQQQVTP